VRWRRRAGLAALKAKEADKPVQFPRFDSLKISLNHAAARCACAI